jgi:hypothetical protein
MKTLAEKAKYQRDWNLRNPDKKKANSHATYRRAHPEVKRVWVNPRRPNGSLTTGGLRERNLWKRFRITLEQYEEKFKTQHGLCSICKCPERRLGKDGKPLQLCVDHDHVTDTIRQLLCGDCNTAIGLMKEDVLRLQSAIDYLLRHRGV